MVTFGVIVKSSKDMMIQFKLEHLDASLNITVWCSRYEPLSIPTAKLSLCNMLTHSALLFEVTFDVSEDLNSEHHHFKNLAL